NPQNPPLSRHLGKYRAHPNRRRADRLSAAPSGASGTTSHQQPARLRATGPCQFDASPAPGSSPRNRAATRLHPSTTGAAMEPTLTRPAATTHDTCITAPMKPRERTGQVSIASARTGRRFRSHADTEQRSEQKQEKEARRQAGQEIAD